MQNFKIIIHDCFLGVPTSPVKKNILTDSSHLLKKARDAIFIQKKSTRHLLDYSYTVIFCT